MLQTIRLVAARFIRDEEGATLVEYVLLVTQITVAAVVAISFLGGLPPVF